MRLIAPRVPHSLVLYLRSGARGRFRGGGRCCGGIRPPIATRTRTKEQWTRIVRNRGDDTTGFRRASWGAVAKTWRWPHLSWFARETWYRRNLKFEIPDAPRARRQTTTFSQGRAVAMRTSTRRGAGVKTSSGAHTPSRPPLQSSPVPPSLGLATAARRRYSSRRDWARSRFPRSRVPKFHLHTWVSRGAQHRTARVFRPDLAPVRLTSLPP